MNSRMKRTNAEIRDDAKQKWNADAVLRAEFDNEFDRFLAYLTAEAAGLVRVMKDQVRHA